MHVEELMTRDVATCTADANLESAAIMMWDKDCGSVAVVDDSGKTIGIITDRDIAMGCALNHKAEWELKANEVLNGRDLYTCQADMDILDALRVMAEHHVRRLPIVDKEGRLQGIVSIDDIIACVDRNPDGERKLGFGMWDTVGTLQSLVKHH